MKHIVIFIISLTSVCFPSSLQSQQNELYIEYNEALKRGNYFFEKQLFGQSQMEFKKIISDDKQVNDPEWRQLMMQAELNYARAAVRLEDQDSERLILAFVEKYSPEPLVVDAIMEAADYFYNNEDYENSLTFYNLVNINQVDKDLQSELTFKKGYSLFVRKHFKESLSYFVSLTETTDRYYYPSNYYTGLNYYFLKDYESSIKNFNRVEKSKTYKDHIPYYLAQIYFTEGRYQETIDYIKPRLKDKSIKKQKDLEHLLGKSYFELEDYKNSLTYLESYASQTEKMTKEEFYQTGFVQYKNGKFKKAIANFDELSKLNTALGQNAQFILGDCYLKTGQKAFAKNAFLDCSKKEFDKETKDEAYWNYAKLSYELKYDEQALKSLQSIPTSSKHHGEAQTYLSNIFLNTSDYAKAIEILDKLKGRSTNLENTLQKVSYARALQLYNEGSLEEAKALFTKSLTHGTDTKTKALTNFRLADIAYESKDYNSSKVHLQHFISDATVVSNLPEDASIYMGHYNLGYASLKNLDYQSSLNHFEKAFEGIGSQRNSIRNPYVKNQIYIDAVQKAGDSAFKLNQYDKANRYYDLVINQEKGDVSYALLQKSMVQGLKGDLAGKNRSLENLITKYPKSAYVDDALFQIGVNLQEQGELVQAQTPLEKIIDAHPESNLYNQTLLKLGLLNYNLEDFDSSIAYYKKVFQHNPDEVEAQAALSALEEIYVKDLGRPRDYFKFKESIPGLQVDDEERESLNFKTAEVAYENAQYEKAIKFYQEYLLQYPNGKYSLTANYDLGESYASLNMFPESLMQYEKVVAKGQSKYYLKALEKASLIAYNFEEDFNKSFRYYKSFEELADSPEKKLQAQIGMLESAYRVKNSSAVFLTAKKIEENNLAQADEKSIAAFYRAKVAFDNLDYNQALEGFNKSLKHVKTGKIAAESRYQIAYIYYLEEEYEISKGICYNTHKESAGQSYWIAKSALLLSDILVKEGDLLNAKVTLEAIVESSSKLADDVVLEARQKLVKLQAKIESSSKIDLGDAKEELELESEPEQNKN